MDLDDVNLWKRRLEELEGDAAALGEVMASINYSVVVPEVEWTVWAPCASPAVVIAVNRESAARRYVRKRYRPGDAPREVFTRGTDGVLRLVALSYSTVIAAEALDNGRGLRAGMEHGE